MVHLDSIGMTKDGMMDMRFTGSVIKDGRFDGLKTTPIVQSKNIKQ